MTGDPTEGALITVAHKAGLDVSRSPPRLDSIPFDSQHQYMATLHEGGVVYVKGAAEVLLERCDGGLDASGQPVTCSADRFRADMEEMASRGLRVLAFARLEKPGATKLSFDDIQGLTLLGLQGMIDPPRPEAIAAVRASQQAGIVVKMITGDHALTAAAIGRQIGLCSGDCGEVLTGAELAKLTDAELIEKAQQVNVFARVAPEQKLRLVEALQARGHVVAMTGDGVNDAPALKQSDIGVAMGITGTDVSKEAADMILTDDNFASIEAAVEEGRGVFDNLTKFIAWTLPTNLGEGLVLLAAIVAGATLPILPIQILWINMVTAAVLGTTLALEPKELDLMQRKPRDPKAPILNSALICAYHPGRPDHPGRRLRPVRVRTGPRRLGRGGPHGGGQRGHLRRDPLPVQCPLADQVPVPAGLLLQPLGDRRRDRDGADPDALHLRPLHEPPVRQRADETITLAGCACRQSGRFCHYRV